MKDRPALFKIAVRDLFQSRREWDNFFLCSTSVEVSEEKYLCGFLEHAYFRDRSFWMQKKLNTIVSE